MILTKELYKKIKRMNRREIEIFICNIYKGAYDDGFTDLDLEELYGKLLEIKGIGPVKANLIIKTIKNIL